MYTIVLVRLECVQSGLFGRYGRHERTDRDWPISVQPGKAPHSLNCADTRSLPRLRTGDVAKLRCAGRQEHGKRSEMEKGNAGKAGDAENAGWEKERQERGEGEGASHAQEVSRASKTPVHMGSVVSGIKNTLLGRRFVLNRSFELLADMLSSVVVARVRFVQQSIENLREKVRRMNVLQAVARGSLHVFFPLL